MTQINIEHLSIGTLIVLEGSFAEVQSVTFQPDDRSYSVGVVYDGDTDPTKRWTPDKVTIQCGASVEYGGTGLPALRNPFEVTMDELLAKIAADDTEIDRLLNVQSVRADGLRELTEMLMGQGRL